MEGPPGGGLSGQGGEVSDDKMMEMVELNLKRFDLELHEGMGFLEISCSFCEHYKKCDDCPLYGGAINKDCLTAVFNNYTWRDVIGIWDNRRAVPIYLAGCVAFYRKWKESDMMPILSYATKGE